MTERAVDRRRGRVLARASPTSTGFPSPLRAVPRRDRPRPVVPAGSVALADGHAAVYPTASPGGWQLVGRTGFPLFSLERAPVRRAHAGRPGPVHRGGRRRPARSGPGARHRLGRRRRSVACSRSWRPGCAPSCRTAAAGAWPRSVCRTRPPPIGMSFALANRLVGNAAGSGTLELTGGGTRLRCLAACHVAVVGAAPGLRRRRHARCRPARSCPWRAGRSSRWGALQRGCRTYLSVAGGFLGPEVFGSSASDELTGLGAGPLDPGGVLDAGPWTPPLGDHLLAGRRHRGRRGRRARGASRRARSASRAVRAGRTGEAGRHRLPRPAATATASGSGCGRRVGRPTCDRTGGGAPTSSTRRAW